MILKKNEGAEPDDPPTSRGALKKIPSKEKQ